MTLWPLVFLAAVVAAWHRLGQLLEGRRDAREFADKLTAYAGEARQMREAMAKEQAELASRLGRVEMALRER